MRAYKVILVKNSNVPKHFTIITTSIYEAEAIGKNYANNKGFRFLSVVETSKKIIIDTSTRSDYKLRNLLDDTWYDKI